jgi:ankyrin repeat protein
MLVDAGADVNAFVDEYESSALILAMSWREFRVMELLVKAGADVKARGRNGDTVLCDAFHPGQRANSSTYKRLEQVAQLLLGRGAVLTSGSCN